MCQNAGERHPFIYRNSTFPQGHCYSDEYFYTLFAISDINFRLPVLFQLVFDMLVLQKHNTEMTVAAGEAFYTLVCLHQVSIAV